MPNTLAHFAINGLFTRTVIHEADLKWIYLGCIIPDLAWILQRVVRALPVAVDLYNVRAYCIAQSSLLISVLICVAFAVLTKQRSKIFFILIIGCLLHLLLDAVQIKWANGVQLMAPYSWELTRFDIFWPESIGTYVLTTMGLIYFIFYFKKSFLGSCDEFILSKKTIIISSILIIFWLLLPVIFIPSIYDVDNHYISTLKDTSNRVGKNIEIDRNKYIHSDTGSTLVTFFGEEIALENIQIESGKLISLQGKFIDNHTIYVDRYHVHTKFRDYASIIGLICVLGIWLIYILRCCVCYFKNNKK